uniref:Cadherin domain-containing protein n=1 Tax=Panagrolaimus superbus TaxID=310955 RepID=A0A914XW69_9BILA
MMQIFAYHEINETDNSFFYHIEGGADGLFAINETNGMISCKELDREKKSEHFLIISVSDNNMPKRADVCTIRVMVADENDNAPVFSSTILQIIEISDLIQVPSLLLKFSAIDADEGDNGVVKYYIKDDPSGSLDIDPDNGDLIFARDYAFPKSEFILTVAAEDYGNKVVKSSEQTLRILWKRSTKGFLRGEPKFLQQKYITYIAEGLPKNTKVMKIETSNKIFPDVPLTLSIMEGNYDSAFTIDDDNYLRTAEELDAEIQTLYTLKVLATGKFVKSAETIIEIRVLDVNDNAPSFPPIKDRQISESLPIGSHITTIMANDVDADIDLEYMINPPNKYFYIGRFTGAIYLKMPLDYEVAKAIVVGIQVFDGVHIVKTNFTVNVLDVNDNPPKFTSDLYKFKVSINTAKNDIIGKVSAQDPDEGPNGEFRFELLNDSENLRIDSKTGELRLKAPLKDGMVYFAPIKAVDRGNPKLSSFAMIQIQFVQNIIQHVAEFKKDRYSFLVAENYPLYLPFGHIELKNQTSFNFESVTLQILDKSYSDIFHLKNNGQLLLLQKIDYEFLKEYRFRVGLFIDENGVTNTSKPKSTASVIVKVSDVNDNAPTFNTDSTKLIKIDEQMKKGAILGRLTATDLDTADNARIHFSILDGNQHGIIRIDATSGAIIYDHWDDEKLYENPGVNSFNLTFMAIDNGSPPLWSIHSAHFVFNVDTWSGSAPMFAVPVYHKYIFENSAIGSVVLKAQAHNKWDYLGNNWKYSISDNDEIFKIESHTGEVFLKGDLDYEKRNNYEFMVTVKDARHRSAVVPVEITVIGVDEFAPVFSKSSYTFEIPINADVGQRIGNVYATDDDIGPDGKVYYSIPDDQYISFIGIDPDAGVLVLRESFPINKSIEQITVIASSGLTQHSRTTVYLEVRFTF